MAPRVDQFIEAMFRKKAEKLCLLTGRSVWIVVDDVEEVILEKNVRTKQIDRLIGPVLTESQRVTFLSDGAASFEYESNRGQVRIKSVRDHNSLSVEVRPLVKAVAEKPKEKRKNSKNKISLNRTNAGMPQGRVGGAVGMEVPLTRSFQLGTSSRGDAPTIDQILTDLVKLGGSDLHLTSGQRPKMRKDGEISDVKGWREVLTSHQVENWMLEVASKRIREQFHDTHDADFAHEIEGISRFRMNMFLDRNGAGAVIRTIPSKILSFDQLDLPDPLRAFCELPKGLVLVTGPTGSGKSTTLAAMIDLINGSRKDHIITIEDPIEFVHQSRTCLINQREVHTHTESFSRALRAALREDPDIVLVGELRDLETVHIALETAETGHLVFGTLHTNTAASTIDRIIDQFPTDRQSQIRVMLSESLKGVVAQTLCKRIGGGRVACLEILVVTSAISNLIREGKTFQIASMMQAGKKLGMQTNNDAMMRLVKDKIITPREAYNKAIDQAALKQAVEREGMSLDDN